MPATDLEKLVIQLDADVSRLNKAMDGVTASVNRAMNGVENRTSQMATRINSTFGAIERSFARIFTVRAAFNFGREIFNNFDQIAQSARDLGVAVDDNLVVRMNRSEKEFITAWRRIQVATAPLIADIADNAATLVETIAKLATDIPSHTSGLGKFLDDTDRAIGNLILKGIGQGEAFPNGAPGNIYSRINPIPLTGPSLASTSEAMAAHLIPNSADITAAVDGTRKIVDALEDQVRLLTVSASNRKIEVELMGQAEAAGARLLTQRNIDLELMKAEREAGRILTKDEEEKIAGLVRERDLRTAIQQRQMDLVNAQAASAGRLTTSGFNAAHPGVISALDEQSAARVKQIIDQSLAAEAQRDRVSDRMTVNQSKYLEGLEREVTLAGLSTHQREVQSELYQAQDVFARNLTEEEQSRIGALVHQRQLLEEQQQISERIASDFADIGTSVISGSESFGKAIQRMIADLSQFILKLELTKIAESALGGGSFLSRLFGGGGLSGGLASGAGLFPDVAITPRFRASGGPVSAGMPYMVGEHGPEMFIPNLSGMISPNARSRGDVNVTVVQNINGNGDKALAAITQTAVLGAVSQIKRQLPAMLADTQMRYG